MEAAASPGTGTGSCAKTTDDTKRMSASETKRRFIKFLRFAERVDVDYENRRREELSFPEKVLDLLGQRIIEIIGNDELSLC